MIVKFVFTVENHSITASSQTFYWYKIIKESVKLINYESEPEHCPMTKNRSNGYGTSKRMGSLTAGLLMEESNRSCFPKNYVFVYLWENFLSPKENNKQFQRSH